jgi:hypothetical protein
MTRIFQMREVHLEALAEVALNSFGVRGSAHLRESLPKASSRFTDAELRALVRDCVDLAETYDLATEQQVMAFAEVALLLGPDFDTNPKHEWATHVLKSDSLDDDERISLLMLGAGPDRFVEGA